MRRTTVALVGTAMLAVLAAGCGTDPEPSSSSTSERTGKGGKATRSADGAPTDAGSSAASQDAGDVPSGPPFPDGTGVQAADPEGEWDLVLTDVRVGDHDGFDRVVLEFTGGTVPGWSVQYVDRPVLEGSGDVVSVPGDTYLDVQAAGTTYPAEGAEQYDGPREVVPSSGGDVAGLYVSGTFEGYTQVVVGLDGDRVPFRVFPLADPARLVVDVRTG